MTFPVKTLKNGFSLPALGLGTWKMGGDRERDPANDDARDITALKMAIDSGFTHIDTAESYAGGHAETLLGQAISGYDREKLVIATKVWPVNMGYDDLSSSLRGSLKRLNTDYVDLYYLHEANHNIPFEETAKALNESYKEGLIKNVAVANFLPQTFDKMQALLEMPIVANQVHYNLMFREPVIRGMLEHAVQNDYLLAAWRPIRFTSRNSQTPNANVWEKSAYPIIEEIANNYNKTNIQIAINWLTSQPNVVTLAKSSNPVHLQELIGSIGWEMAQQDIDRLAKEFPDQKTVSDSSVSLS